MSAVSEISSKRMPAAFRWGVLACLLLLGAVAGGLLLIRSEELRMNYSDIISPVVDLLSSGFLFLAAQRSFAHSKRMGAAWAILGLAALLYAVGDITWAVLEVGMKATPFPSVADAFYLTYYPIFLLGVLLLVVRPASRREVLNDGLDLTVILTAAILGFGNLLIGPILQSNAGAPALDLVILTAYPAGDLVMLGAVLLILYRNPNGASAPPAARGVRQPAIPVYLLGAGILVMIVSDCLYTYQYLQGTYVSGGLLDLGWTIANLLIGVAGIAQWVGLQAGNTISNYQPSIRLQATTRWIKTYLPYLWLLEAFVLLIAAGLSPLPMSFAEIAVGVGMVLGLVLLRQFITLSENNRLNLRLKQQTERLQNINEELHREIGERLRAQEQLAFDVLHDQMTGLANRRLFIDRLWQAIKRSKRHPRGSFAVLFMDLDQFKMVNDSLGHSTGDQLLISIGKRLNETLRTSDTVARFGGDEFAILLEEVDGEDAARIVAERVRDAVSKPFRLNELDVHVTGSIGIVTDATKYEQPDDLLRDVDLAMYKAKALGKARCTMFRTELRDEAHTRLTLMEGLRKGITNAEFRLFYQPIASLETDRIVGLEALIRWQHPTRGLLIPAEFLSVAEETDLILELGDWVLHEACRQLKAWQDQYAHLAGLTINVNVSNREFSQPDLARKVQRALEASGLQGASLRLEITERVLVENYPTAKDAIVALNEMGVEVEIDDFGTGYSALAYLQQFPINAIKIDKSFISEMRKNRKGLGLVRAIVAMARELGMDTIAEGIETGEQLSELKGLSCGYGQGFLLSHPLDANATVELLSRDRR